MIVLDTDLLTLLERDDAPARQLVRRLAEVDPAVVCTTIVNFEEQMRGWLAVVAQARSVRQQVAAYDRLRQFVDNYRHTLLLRFDESAAVEFQRLRRTYRRLGTNDLKIAAIVIANRAKLLTRNMSHFRQIEGLDAEDWTV
ncbi:MAG TPA: type II toxin-antitoxin system VapC family toxin [Terriglobales bacterium]|nr:type II toxin-antitoxin system VapC family toxin [Terriglobales bacterium]